MPDERPTFNLINEPFLPCVRPNGDIVELGLRETLANAHELRELRAASPLVTIALHRLLIAILHAALEDPQSLKDWDELWNVREFDVQKIDAYFDKWRQQFNLLDPVRPFYQDASIDESSEKRSSTNRLITGTNPTNTLFEHAVNPIRDQSTWERITFGEAAKRLIALQVCAIAGGRGYSKMPFADAIAFTAIGRNLFETLLLNFFPAEEREEVFVPLGNPVWERNSNNEENDGTIRGYLNFLTWQPRRVLIYPDSESRVHHVSVTTGSHLQLPENCSEPWCAYKGHTVRLRFSDERAVWRDSECLLQFLDDSPQRAPAVLRFVSDLKSEGVLDIDEIQVAALGQLAKNANVSFTRHETLPLPLKYLTDSDLVSRLSTAVTRAEEIAKHLYLSVRDAATAILDPTNGKPDPKQRKKLIASLGAERLYWSRLETSFRSFFVHLADADSEDDVERDRQIARWVIDDCQRTAYRAFDESVGTLDRSARTLRALQKGRDALGKRTNSLIKKHNHREARNAGS